MNDIGFVENGISKRRAKNIFLRLKGPRSITTNQYNYDLICSRICSQLLYKFSQNVLQKDILRENTLELFCSSRAFGPCSRAFGPPRCEAPRHISPAWTTNQYLSFDSVQRYPEMSGILISEACFHFYKKWRQNIDFERSGKEIF